MLVEPPDPSPPPDGAPGPETAAGRAPDTAAPLVDSWTRRLRRSGRRPRVALVEGTDDRVLWAAARLAGQGAVTPVLVGDPARIRAHAAEAGLALPEDPAVLDILDPAKMSADRGYTSALGVALGSRRGLPAARRRELSADPLYLAATALRIGEADVCIAGSDRPTSDVLRAGLHVVGLAPGTRTLSSCFLMALPDGRTLAYGDCAVVVDPTPAQLADIAHATAGTYEALTGDVARVALLSFSTRASARHPRVERVREAVELVRASGTGLVIDGDLQYDAAAVPEVGRDKVPSSPLEGRANTFVFPCLEAGNISYKVAQRVGGAAAIGPLLQGLAAPLHDLSRGCSGPDVAALALAGALQSVEGTGSHAGHPPEPPDQEEAACP